MNTKTALVTGATDGIGKALAAKLLARDWDVTIVGRSPQKCADTVTELKSLTGKNSISALEADLSSLQKTKEACDHFLATHTSLDLLVLNANAIANERIVTAEGHEQNFAIGYLSRILMLKKLEETLVATKGSQILSVIGLDTTRLDFDDPTIEKDFTGRKGLTPEKAADNMLKVLDDVAQKHKNGATYAWSKERSALKLETRPGDLECLEVLTKGILMGYL